MAILPVQRNVISPIPPLRLGGMSIPGQTEELLEKWLPQFLNRTYVARVDTATDPVASGVAAPVLILPDSFGFWLVGVGIGAVADAVNYQAYALIAKDGTSGRVLVNWNAPLQTITLTGGNTINSVQTSGSTLSIVGMAAQLLHFQGTR